MVIVVVGLGPGPASLLTAETARLLASGATVILRTRRHPAVGEIPGSERWLDCDDIYAAGVSFDGVYAAVAERVLSVAESGDAVFAVPGHPLIAEASVGRLLAAAKERGTGVTVHPAVSFVDMAAAALGLDLGTVQVCDALAPRFDTQRPALFAQVYDRDTATALKTVLLEAYPPEHETTVLRALGGGSQRVESRPLAAIDHEAWGYLDSLYVPALDPIADVRRFDGLHAIVHALHAPGGCPWDREQTHESLRHYLLEETYEVLEAIDSGDAEQLTEELGDLLLQVLMHTSVGEREGTFAFGDVSEGIARKLVRRHPHVFGDGSARTAAEVYQKWDELKKAEKPRSSALEGVPLSLPALAQAQSVQGRARRSGFEWPDMQGPLEKLVEEMREFATAPTDGQREAEFGDLLFVVAGIGQRLGIDAEQALRGASARFRRRFAAMESRLAVAGEEMKDAGLDRLLALWTEAKAAAR